MTEEKNLSFSPDTDVSLYFMKKGMCVTHFRALHQLTDVVFL